MSSAQADQTCFFVVGGEYADTNFDRPAEGVTLERHGPMTEHQAHDLWRNLTSKTVDNAMVRYVVEEACPVEEAVYVVGGEYADTGFVRLVPGCALEVEGPFSRVEALNHWRAMTARTVDSCLHRYDVMTAGELAALRDRMAK